MQNQDTNRKYANKNNQVSRFTFSRIKIKSITGSRWEQNIIPDTNKFRIKVNQMKALQQKQYD